MKSKLQINDDFGGSIFQNGIKNADFIVFNPMNIKLTKEVPVLNPAKLNNTDFWKHIKSLTWSSGCRYFFCVNNKSIVIGNVYDDKAFVCENRSMRVFEEFFKAFK